MTATISATRAGRSFDSGTEMLARMRRETSKANLSRDGYEDIAIIAAVLARTTTNIVTAIELHRTAQLCAKAAGMEQMSISEGKQGLHLAEAFNRGEDLPVSEPETPESIAFETELAKAARFTPPPSAILRADDDEPAMAAVAAVMAGPEGGVMAPDQIEALGIDRLHIRTG